MRPTTALLVACAALCTSSTRAHAQLFDRLLNPQITVTLSHPPGLGLRVSRIAVAQAVGDKADQVADAITSDFVTGGMEVMDRQHLQSTIAEHQLNLSGMVDQQTAMAMGKFLGSTALIFINVQRAATAQQSLHDFVEDSRRIQHVRYISQTRASLKVSVQTVDLTTGRTFQAKVFEANPVVQTSSIDQCCAEFPTDFEVFDAAIQTVVSQVHAQFLPWTEERKVFFFDDKDCQLKVAFNLLKAGDLDGAAKQSEANVVACQAGPKVDAKKLAHSLYNVGMTAFLASDYAKASDFFAQAQRAKVIGITTEAMAELNRAMALETESRRVDERTAQAAAAQATTAPAPPPVAPAPAPAQTASRRTSATPPTAVKVKATPSERLKQANELLKQGLITQDEYDKKKAEILKDM